MEELLQTIYGIGPINSKKIEEKLLRLNLGSDNIEQLRHNLKDSRIFPDLQIITQVDLLYNPLKLIPRDIIYIIEDELKKYFNGKFEIAGSFRRNKLFSRDVDLVMVKQTNIIHNLINSINNNSKHLYIYKPYAGEEKISIIFEILVPVHLRKKLRKYMTTTKKVRIKTDIFLCESSEYIYTLLFATGSGDFNVRMRAIAKNQGYLLNQKGLFDKKTMEKIKIKNEKEIFSLLNMPFQLPEFR
jgi:DNA polymerase/3'-5' exonuclease PolX